MGLERNIVIFDPHPLHSDFTRMLTANFKAHYSARALDLEGNTNLIWELGEDARCDILTQSVIYEELS